ncbi:cysteine-rich CWC family protein [Nitrospira sp. Nam74]
MGIDKTCERCGLTFQCGGPGCWCMQVPLTHSQREGIAMQFLDCLCPHCLPQVAYKGSQAITDIRLNESGGRDQPEPKR